MAWERRRDLEGGKELGVWLKIEDNEVVKELYVESLEYKNRDFQVHTLDENGEWTKQGEFPTVEEAFEKADSIIEEDGNN